MSTKPTSTRFQQMLANNKPPTIKTTGLEQAQAFLKQHPIVHHSLPAGSEHLHQLTGSCSCQPRVKQDPTAWYALQVQHFVQAPEDPTDWQEWEDLKASEDRRREGG